MFRLDAAQPVRSGDGLTRRDFLHAGTVSALGLGLPASSALGARGGRDRSGDINCILLFLVGGPSHLDTWDPKPDATEEVRGPFRPIATRVPGVQISQIFPRLATMMDRVSLVRTVYHTASAVHDTGHQMMQTGRLFRGGIEHPHYGCVLARLKGGRNGAPPHVLLPRPIGATGGNLPHGQSAGYLGKAFDPVVFDADPDFSAVREEQRRSLRPALDLRAEPDAVRDRYGRNRFGQSCLRARRLIEHGVRFVTVNMFETVFHEATWDSHGAAPFTAIESYQTDIGPNFDAAYTALLDDLGRRGLLATTLVLAFSEFGRTPRINPAGGRDHHPACWSVLLAGGPIEAGQVVGASDATGHAPKDRPVSTAELAATVYQALGIDLDTELPGPHGQPIRVVDSGVEAVEELF